MEEFLDCTKGVREALWYADNCAKCTKCGTSECPHPNEWFWKKKKPVFCKDLKAKERMRNNENHCCLENF